MSKIIVKSDVNNETYPLIKYAGRHFYLGDLLSYEKK